MSVYVDDDKIVYDVIAEEKNILGGISRTPNMEENFRLGSRINKGGEPPTATMEAEKRIRREIANSNERRRMQSINNGFQSLRSLLPHHEGEKLSKAAILQQTAEYIYSLEQEKTRLLSQNCQLKRLVSQHESGGGGGGGGELPPKKRKTELILPTLTAESSDEGLGSMSPEPVGLIRVDVSSDPTTDLRRQLERERALRIALEEQMRQYESQIYHQQQQTTPQPQIYQVETNDELALQLVSAECLPPVGHTQTVVCSPPNSRSPSPEPQEQKLPSVLEAAIKAEPKVEVERLPSPIPGHEDTNAPRFPPNSFSATNTSRQNLETIVEAIRHLEGDHMFGDEPLTQEVPLALTKNERVNPSSVASLVEFNAAIVQQSQQSRPGVIVVKQAS